MTSRGQLAIVLHTHMPYVTGFGTWPFGEEWLWEAIATSYLPLLDVLDDEPGPPVTLSLTPVLCDQLADGAAMARCLSFLREIRPESHRRDATELRGSGEPVLAAEIERSAEEYASLADALESRERRAGGLLGALGAHASWTSSATHAVLPLIATDAGTDLQIATGIGSHRARFGDWAGGFWLPECGYAPSLDPALERVGVRATCVELTRHLGRGAPAHLRPLATDDGPVLWPIDRATIDRVWAHGGYPGGVDYRDYHRYTTHRHRAWRIDGGPYDPAAALARADRDAADFVAAVTERVADGGVCVCALDTELLGHWWYEGPQWLRAVLRHARGAGLGIVRLDDAVDRVPATPAAAVGLGAHATSWGTGNDLRTWSGPAVARFAWRARAAELSLARGAGRPPQAALRELLALQASDWAFLEDGRLAGDYPSQRAEGHAAGLAAALAGGPADPRLDALAPSLAGWG